MNSQHQRFWISEQTPGKMVKCAPRSPDVTRARTPNPSLRISSWWRSKTEEHFNTNTESGKLGIIFGFSSSAYMRNQSSNLARTSLVLEMSQYEIRWDLDGRNDTLDSDKMDSKHCYLYWDLGFACGRFMKKANRRSLKHYNCSHDDCRNFSYNDHRAIQHPPVSICRGNKEKLVGMNKLYDRPIWFHKHSSPNNTRRHVRNMMWSYRLLTRTYLEQF